MNTEKIAALKTADRAAVNDVLRRIAKEIRARQTPGVINPQDEQLLDLIDCITIVNGRYV